MLSLLRSPFFRHPGLAARKVAERLDCRVPLRWTPPPPDAAYRISPAWIVPVRDWALDCGLAPAREPTEVWGVAYPLEELLDACRRGPAHTPDARGDIKRIWDFSRCQALPLMALHAPDAPDAIEAGATFLRRWFAANDRPDGLNWTCAMEVAIRAVNLLLADGLWTGRLREHLGPTEWDRWLWHHGQSIWHGLEARRHPSNHYLADLLGLAALGAAFAGDADAARWRRFAQTEFPRALLAQTWPDGGLREASLPYHALVTEMAWLFVALTGVPPRGRFAARLDAMTRILTDARCEVTGDVFPVGDDDSGRILDLVAPGRARALEQLAAQLTGGAARTARAAHYPRSGWLILRDAGWTVLLEHGGVGLDGVGAHAHNDDLSLCVNHDGRRWVTDPGSHLYTPDPVRRNAFRSARSHATLMLDDAEPNPLPAAPPLDHVFLLPGRARAWPARLEHARCGQARRRWNGAAHTRRIELCDGGLHVTDTLTLRRAAAVTATLPLAPGVTADVSPDGEVMLRQGDAAMRLRARPAPACAIVASEHAPRYGQCVPAARVIARFQAPAGATTLEWSLEPVGGQPFS